MAALDLSQLPTLSSAGAPPSGNWLTSGFKTGLYEGLGQLGSAVQGAGALVGADGVAQAGSDFAAAQAANVARVAKPGLDNWSSPSGIGYNIARAIPSTLGMIGAGALGVAALPEAIPAAVAGGIAAGVTGYPLMFGGAVDAAKQAAGGTLSQEDAAKAAGIAVPEAALGAIMPGRLSNILKKGSEGGFAKRLLTGAAVNAPVQGVVAGADTAITQQAFTPDVPMDQRAHEIINNAIGGAVTGGVFGGAIHALSGRRAPDAPPPSNTDMAAAIDKDLGRVGPGLPEGPRLEQQGPPESSNMQPGNIGGTTRYGPGLPEGPRIETEGPPEPVTVTRPALPVEQDPNGQTRLPGIPDPMVEAPPRPGEPVVAAPDPNQLKLLTPQEDASRAPLIDALRADVEQQVGAVGAKHPFVQNLDAANHPELINAIRDQQQLFDEQGRTPKWFSQLADTMGVTDATGAPRDPRAELKASQDDLTSTQAKRQADYQDLLDKASKKGIDTPQGKLLFDRANKVKAVDDAPATSKISALQELVGKHDQADALRDAKDPVPDRVNDAFKGDWATVNNIVGLSELKDPILKALGDKAIEIQKQIEQNAPDAKNVKYKVMALQKELRQKFGEKYRDRVTVEKATGEKEPPVEIKGEPPANIDQLGLQEPVDTTPVGTIPREPVAAAPVELPVSRGETPLAPPAEPTPAAPERPRMSQAERDAETFAANEKFHQDRLAMLSQLAPERGLGRNLPLPTPVEAPVSATPKQDAISKRAQNRMAEERAAADREASVRETASQKLARMHNEGAVRSQATDALRDTQVSDGVRKQLVDAAQKNNMPAAREALRAYREEMKARGETAPPPSPPVAEPAPTPGAKPTLRKKVPDWARAHAEALQGEVSFHNNDVALVRGLDPETGDLKYFGVNQKTGLHSMSDVDALSSKQALFSNEQLAQLRDAKRAFLAKDLNSFNANPDGPFTGAKDNVVTTAGVDPQMGRYVSSVLNKLGYGNIRVLLSTHEDLAPGAESTYKLHGDYAGALEGRADKSLNNEATVRRFGPGYKDFAIQLDRSLPPEVQIQTIGHEIGHMAQIVSFNNAPAPVRAKVMAAFNQWIKSTQGMSDKEIITSTRNLDVADRINKGLDRGGSIDMNYIKSFPEWFADQVGRYTTSDKKPLGVIQQFFASVAAKMREVVATLTGRDVEPNEAVRSFIENMPPASGDNWLASRGGPNGKMEVSESRGARTTTEASDMLRSFASKAVETRAPAEEMIGRMATGAGTNVSHWVRKKLMYAATSRAIVDAYKKLLPSGVKYVEGQTKRDVLTATVNQKSVRGQQEAAALPSKTQELLQKVMAYTIHNLDPRKTMAQHTWLEAKDRARLGDVLREANEDWRKLSQMGGAKAYEALRAGNVADHMASMAIGLHEHVNSGLYEKGSIPGFDVNPIDAYRFASDLHDDPTKAMGYWVKEGMDRVRSAQEYVDKQETRAEELKQDGKKAEAGKVLNDIGLLKDKLKDVAQGMGQTMNAPYFHIGRSGDYFVSGHMKMDPDGTVNAAALQATQKALNDGGFKNLSLQRASDQSKMYARVETPGQMQALHGIILKLADAGHFDKTKDILQGEPKQVDTMKGLLPAHLLRQIEASEKAVGDHVEGMDAKQESDYRTAHADMQRDLVRKWLDMQPDNSINKVLQERKGIHGFETNMLASYAHRSTISARAVTSLATSREMAEHVEGMAKEAKDLMKDRMATAGQVLGARAAVNELMLREAQRQWSVQNPTRDGVRAITHIAFVGTSPAYVLTLMAQIPSLSLPALGRSHGYTKSSVALAKAAPMAIKIMNAIMSGPDAATVGFSRLALEKANIPKDVVDFIMRASNNGDMNNGSYTHANYQLADGANPTLMKVKNWASVMGLGAEMFPRILTALAAKDLHAQKPMGDLHEFVSKAVRDSQFDWSASGNPRLTGKMGILGPSTPLMLAFTGFQTRMIESLYRNVHDAISKNSTPEEASQARKFLAGHLAATVAVAGSMGLPAAGWVAGAADMASNWLTGRDDFDVNASYRHFLASTFGKEAGEVLARGLPRLAGIDLSHMGEQNLIPGTQFMQEKRKFEDAERDWAKSLLGSAAGLAADAYMGVRDMHNGDWLLGAQKFAPAGLKGGIQAMRLSMNGYEDKNGTKLPLNAGALEILMTALDLKPAAEAEYNETVKTQQGLNAAREYHSQNISRHLALTTQRGDTEGFQGWMQEAAQFQQEHPGLVSPAMSLGKTLQTHMINSAVARGFGIPVGTQPRDLGLRGMVDYGNYRLNE